jgi:hypothetical protein
MKPELNLNVDGPDKVPGVLRAAADAYAAGANELAAAWQDDRIPMIWAKIADELTLAADRIEKEIERHSSMPAARVHRSTKNLCTGRWSKPRPE